jgi:hypothetical protein
MGLADRACSELGRLILVAPPNPGLQCIALVAPLRRPIEDRVVAHQELDSAPGGRIGLVTQVTDSTTETVTAPPISWSYLDQHSATASCPPVGVVAWPLRVLDVDNVRVCQTLHQSERCFSLPTRAMASKNRRTISTFSSDIAYSDSPAASRASARFPKLLMRITLGPRNVQSVKYPTSVGTPLARPTAR